jgi:hypothetical protein
MELGRAVRCCHGDFLLRDGPQFSRRRWLNLSCPELKGWCQFTPRHWLRATTNTGLTEDESFMAESFARFFGRGCD